MICRRYCRMIAASFVAAFAAASVMAEDPPAPAAASDKSVAARDKPVAKFVFKGRGDGRITIVENGTAREVEAPTGIVKMDPESAAREERRKAELEDQALRREERLKQGEAGEAPLDSPESPEVPDTPQVAPAPDGPDEAPKARAADDSAPRSRLAPAKKKVEPVDPKAEPKPKPKPKPKPGDKPARKVYDPSK